MAFEDERGRNTGTGHGPPAKPSTEQGEYRTEITSWSLLAPCTVRCLGSPREDPQATAPGVEIHLQAHWRGERTLTSSLARLRSRSTGHKKAVKDCHSRRDGTPASLPQHCRGGRREIVGTVKPDPAEEQQGPQRRRIRPKRGEEERGESGLAARAPSKKHLLRGTRDRCRARPRRERLTETENGAQ
ncbi:hypothetical protein NDU88_004381 [Pleurodeles waltl]|uniref:Uncharacterized protein n=1 Tax=Pleurodeles waltl TaxID=8319 RepID=A0AAV7LJR7_PLEWA|nr:hypothetical protein NDU88_004381 [Pleurodeles waltl]